MARRRALPATAAVIVATGLMLGAGGRLGMLELTVGDLTDVAWPVPDRPETDPDRAAVTGPVPTPGPAPWTSPGPAPDPAPAGPHARLRAATAPVSLRIGGLDVRAPLVKVGVLPGGTMEIPDDVATVGWYATAERRVSPGDPGVAVLAGHRDSREQGPGALHDIAGLAAGDTIHVVHADGAVSTWSVDEVLTTPRDRLPSRLLFAREGAPRLALVTCGGTFDAATRSYSHNTIVLASLVPSRAAMSAAR
jgi:hypothetical protein